MPHWVCEGWHAWERAPFISESDRERTPEERVGDLKTRHAIFSFIEQLIAEEKLNGTSYPRESLSELATFLNNLSSKGREELLAGLRHQAWSSDAKDSHRFGILQSLAATDSLWPPLILLRQPPQYSNGTPKAPCSMMK